METSMMKTRVVPVGRNAASFIGKLKLAPVPQDPLASTGRRIRLLREKLELSRPIFADRIGIKQTSLKNYELFFRAVDFDAVRNICELFRPEVRDEVSQYLALGNHINVGRVPAVGREHLIDGNIAEREGGIRGVTDDDLMLIKLIRAVRTEAFQLSRPRFVDLFKDGLPPTTLKNYEMGYRRISYPFARALAELANDPLAAWNSIAAASRNQGVDISPWVCPT